MFGVFLFKQMVKKESKASLQMIHEWTGFSLQEVELAKAIPNERLMLLSWRNRFRNKWIKNIANNLSNSERLSNRK